jgi:hypothetical protein
MRVISCRPPWWDAIPCALFCTGVSVAMVTVNTRDYASGRASAWVFLPTILSVLILMTFAYRVVRLSFRADAAGVAIRNIFRTRHIPLAQITGFDVRARFVLRTFTVRVITRSGTFPIGVYMRRSGLLFDHLCDIADELDDWLAEAQGRKAADTPATMSAASRVSRAEEFHLWASSFLRLWR